MDRQHAVMDNQFHVTVNNVDCNAQVTRDGTRVTLDMTCRHTARRQARIGEPLALRAWGHLRQDQRLAVQYGVWVLWDSAEHQRLRWGEDVLSVPQDLEPWLRQLGFPASVAESLAEHLATWLRSTSEPGS